MKGARGLKKRGNGNERLLSFLNVAIDVDLFVRKSLRKRGWSLSLSLIYAHVRRRFARAHGATPKGCERGKENHLGGPATRFVCARDRTTICLSLYEISLVPARAIIMKFTRVLESILPRQPDVTRLRE